MKDRGEMNLTRSFFLLHSTSNSCGVLLVFLGTNKTIVKEKISDAEARFLILDVEIAGENFVFINLYNANTESKQTKTFENYFRIKSH